MSPQTIQEMPIRPIFNWHAIFSNWNFKLQKIQLKKIAQNLTLKIFLKIFNPNSKNLTLSQNFKP